jgi:hypothetical protein
LTFTPEHAAQIQKNLAGGCGLRAAVPESIAN